MSRATVEPTTGGFGRGDRYNQRARIDRASLQIARKSYWTGAADPANIRVQIIEMISVSI
ncbi:hypothetical protein [Sinorhizobium saheli]|uniref:hypothetical protein n=1 Tax=Sinorhizobium saheli TaxID=36856 RepID=UPI000A6FBFEA|nr:hypothetical protein [Sinorhizobium saheli]MQW89904.1 hypothetical protein [Sinorhizobium saheli]